MAADTANPGLTSSGSAEPRADYREVRFEYTPNLPEILQHVGGSILVTTYQAGKLLVLGVRDAKLQISFVSFEQAMGLAVSPQKIAIGSRRQIHCLVAAPEVTSGANSTSAHNGCFVPRASHHTGQIQVHDLAWGRDGLWVVNTLFSSLCTLHEDYNFVSRWRPPFITQLIDQDRCHLNGMAMQDGLPRFVTVLAQSNEPAGWRPHKVDGGCILEVPSGRVVVRGLSMPHSPRWSNGQLWVLDSGNGRLCLVDIERGSLQPVESVPGYTRGLCFAGQFAFVGLSRIRETAIFGGLPIETQHQELRCGVACIDLVSGRTVATFQFHSGVEEIFAVEFLPACTNPLIAGSTLQEQEREVWIVPPEDRSPGTSSPVLPWFARATIQEAVAQEQSVTPESLLLRARALQQTGDLQQAAAVFEQAIAQSSKPGPLLVDLGNLHQERGDQERALICYERAVLADPECIPARQNLGYLLFNRGEPERSVEQYEALLRLDPRPLNQLLASTVLPIVYDSREDVLRWRERLESGLAQMVADGQQVDAMRQLVPTNFFVAYRGLDDYEVMTQIGHIVKGDRELPPRLTQRAGASRRKRIGFLSAYFRNHTIGRLNLGRIRHLNRDDFEVTVAYASRGQDEMSADFQRAADRYVQLPRDVEAAKRQLRELELDVLVFADVGMDALTSTLAFSRMAPIQCVTWGHPQTTGSPTMDYFLSSELLELPSADTHYTERLVRLPLLATYYYRPRREGPLRAREYFHLPSDRHLYVCPQTLFKFHPDFDELLLGILQRDPRADLVLLEGRVPAWTARLQRRFARTLPGLQQRIRFLPAQPLDDYLALLTVCDVMIDPIHFGGGNSSYEALAMGVPIVTLPGDFLRSRITAALYRKMNLPELTAGSGEEYTEMAVRIASCPEERQRMVAAIQARAEALFEDPQEVHVLEEFLRSLDME